MATTVPPPPPPPLPSPPIAALSLLPLPPPLHDSTLRNKDISLLDVCDAPINVEPEIPSSSGLQAKTEVIEVVQRTECPPCKVSLLWKLEESDPPKVPEGYTLVAESKFPIKVEEFFDFFFSDDAINFRESFHEKCGNREFCCSSWSPHDKIGHTRDVSFQHPIKVYFGARCGSCQEVQKYRVYKNSHLILETSQEICDVPYGDYFRVEAHELLKQKKLEQEALGPPTSSDLNGQVHLERQTEVEECSTALHDTNDLRISKDLPGRMTNNSRDVVASSSTSKFVAMLDQQISHLKEEMIMVENLLHKMRHEHDLLKNKLTDLDFCRKMQT